MSETIVFDIGKTNKKVLVFDEALNLIFQEEKNMPTITDDDGFECDDLERMETWIREKVTELVADPRFDVKSLNFSTYGASLVFLDEKGERITPLYNYLKPVCDSIRGGLFARYMVRDEFCRKTASPDLGLLLNSGIQILWLKSEKPDLFKKAKSILHFPNYLSYLFTGKIVSELTSVGCHTFLWDFDQMKPHRWIEDEGIDLPEQVSNFQTETVEIAGKQIKVGTGIHDSSASLVPYLLNEKGTFMLISTGTWCINMNPFNHEPLTRKELENDCLHFLNAFGKPVKSSRLFMGHIHDVNVGRIAGFFGVDSKQYRSVLFDKLKFENCLKEKVFFKNGVPGEYVDESVDLSVFENFASAYCQFITDLTIECSKSIGLVLNEGNELKKLIVTGGFSRNEKFMGVLAMLYPKLEVVRGDIDNATALGAAMVLLEYQSLREPTQFFIRHNVEMTGKRKGSKNS
ncbi:MAG: carbohydrate kinase [Prolixibacteraceae bacterium]|nr:carbohydrate kinase [Prolixibacteraceae bacterium]